tara:strand:+ start:5851 stop:6138 length:288 start_codon:yes stop_codon:yes gene_type:complete
MEPTANAWISPGKDKKNITYRLQVNGIKNSHKKKIAAATAGWREAGSGWNPSSKTEILLFEKSFPDYYSFKKWQRDFPFKLEVEKDGRGRKKKSN